MRVIPLIVGLLREKLLVAGATVTPHDRSERRVGFQRRGIHPHRRAVQQLRLPQDLKHPAERLSMGLHVQPSPVRDTLE